MGERVSRVPDRHAPEDRSASLLRFLGRATRADALYQQEIAQVPQPDFDHFIFTLGRQRFAELVHKFSQKIKSEIGQAIQLDVTDDLASLEDDALDFKMGVNTLASHIRDSRETGTQRFLDLLQSDSYNPADRLIPWRRDIALHFPETIVHEDGLGILVQPTIIADVVVDSVWSEGRELPHRRLLINPNASQLIV